MINVIGGRLGMEDLKKVPLVKPEKAGSRWKGIPHYELASNIEEATRSRGWKIKDARFTLSNDRADMVGAFDLDLGKNGPDTDGGVSLGLGIQTSNAMKRSLMLTVGGTVTVCTNGMITGEILLIKKHTLNLDLFERVDESLDIYQEKTLQIPEVIRNWKERDLVGSEEDQLLLAAGRQGIIPWSKVGKVDAEYKKPSFDYGTKGNTSWDMLNAFTHVVKTSPPLAQMEQINQFRELLPVAA